MEMLPSLEDMTPADWVVAMRGLRDAVAERAAAVLDRHTTAAEAVAELQRVFDRYNDPRLGAQFSDEVVEVDYSVEVRAHDDALVFWVFPTEDYETIVYTAKGYWWLDHQGTDADNDRHALHCDLILRLLRLLPWANDDDLLEMAAIEIASRAG